MIEFGVMSYKDHNFSNPRLIAAAKDGRVWFSLETESGKYKVATADVKQPVRVSVNELQRFPARDLFYERTYYGRMDIVPGQ